MMAYHLAALVYRGIHYIINRKARQQNFLFFSPCELCGLNKN
jgi:hypothetical protein